jgi:hypothetical protein
VRFLKSFYATQGGRARRRGQAQDAAATAIVKAKFKVGDHHSADQQYSGSGKVSGFGERELSAGRISGEQNERRCDARCMEIGVGAGVCWRTRKA